MNRTVKIGHAKIQNYCVGSYCGVSATAAIHTKESICFNDINSYGNEIVLFYVDL